MDLESYVAFISDIAPPNKIDIPRLENQLLTLLRFHRLVQLKGLFHRFQFGLFLFGLSLRCFGESFILFITFVGPPQLRFPEPDLKLFM